MPNYNIADECAEAPAQAEHSTEEQYNGITKDDLKDCVDHIFEIDRLNLKWVKIKTLLH